MSLRIRTCFRIIKLASRAYPIGFAISSHAMHIRCSARICVLGFGVDLYLLLSAFARVCRVCCYFPRGIAKQSIIDLSHILTYPYVAVAAKFAIFMTGQVNV